VFLSLNKLQDCSDALNREYYINQISMGLRSPLHIEYFLQKHKFVKFENVKYYKYYKF